MTESEKSTIGWLSALAIIFWPIMVIVNGYVLTRLWHWFIVPYWRNAVHLSIPMAIGVVLIVAVLTRHTYPSHNPEHECFRQKLNPIIETLAMPFITWFVCWVCHFVIWIAFPPVYPC